MTKEEAKHLSDVLKGYSEGKEVEYLIYDGKWETVPEGELYFGGRPEYYRIKPEPKPRPYHSAEEFLKAQKEHGPYFGIKDGCYMLPTKVYSQKVTVTELLNFTYLHLVKNDFIWQDGTPCGILEE